MVRTREEWFACEQAKYTMAEPLISIEKIGDSAPISFTGTCDLPLKGIRILDNTQIYAALICARYASDAGADVLHLLTPMRLNPNAMDSECMPGKRSAWCDLTDPAMREQFFKLVKDADVFVNNTLNLYRKGITPQALAAAKPGIICVELNCYGFSGPWAGRGGFEQHGQCCTGFNVNEGSTDQPINPPTYLLNDMMGGLEAAIGMFECLSRRAREGGSYLVRVSLAQNCSAMQDFGLIPDSELEGLPKSLMTAPGLNARLRPEFELPLVTATGPRGEIAVLPPQVEFSEFKLGPRFSGDPNGASKLDWSVFKQEIPEKQRKK